MTTYHIPEGAKFQPVEIKNEPCATVEQGLELAAIMEDGPERKQLVNHMAKVLIDYTAPAFIISGSAQDAGAGN